MNISSYKARVTKALKSAGTYRPSLGIQITALASALMTLERATQQIEGLDDVTVLEETRYGSKLAPHPAFKIQRDAQEQVTKQMKQLGLTPSALMEGDGDDNDPLIELTQKLTEI